MDSCTFALTCVVPRTAEVIARYGPKMVLAGISNRTIREGRPDNRKNVHMLDPSLYSIVPRCIGTVAVNARQAAAFHSQCVPMDREQWPGQTSELYWKIGERERSGGTSQRVKTRKGVPISLGVVQRYDELDCPCFPDAISDRLR